ncbi:hypothetical protein SD457_13190 [Coprobacillaceae bacterium CR2/5/TPMF4]|nr:hypothetical protein SD457_13190 [Coprobacillaceae bacterium CR2/5/TPMF4]
MRQNAKELTNEPVNLAAIKAISTACATIQTPSNAFGFYYMEVLLSHILN